MAETMTSRKVKIRLNKIIPGLEYRLRADDQSNGCSGFIRNPKNGKIVYISTTPSCYSPLAQKILWRTASSFKDYTGGTNRWSPITTPSSPNWLTPSAEKRALQ